jgi:hypothetical protein
MKKREYKVFLVEDTKQLEDQLNKYGKLGFKYSSSFSGWVNLKTRKPLRVVVMVKEVKSWWSL